ncbi:ATP-binding protein [Nocardiopsis synnemataformans]|uniref:ATP-binding protein n=1 Tax=Nocardiopsis synnemataformans TaxID=61305 RepID=UPI003EBE8031
MAVAGLPDLVWVVRRFVRAHSGRSREAAVDIDLMTTELFANTLRHSRSGEPGGEVLVVVSKSPRTTQVKLTDQGPRAGTLPHIRSVDVESGEGEDGGFGLRLVDEFASRWGVVHESERTTVWFELDRSTDR